MKFSVFLTFVFLFLFVSSAEARRGCCSWHGGVAGCGENGRQICRDGTYSPTCGCTPPSERANYFNQLYRPNNNYNTLNNTRRINPTNSNYVRQDTIFNNGNRVLHTINTINNNDFSNNDFLKLTIYDTKRMLDRIQLNLATEDDLIFWNKFTAYTRGIIAGFAISKGLTNEQLACTNKSVLTYTYDIVDKYKKGRGYSYDDHIIAEILINISNCLNSLYY